MAATDPAPPLLTSEVAQILRRSEATVRLWETGGLLKAVRTASGVRLFDRADVERLAHELNEGHAVSGVMRRAR